MFCFFKKSCSYPSFRLWVQKTNKKINYYTFKTNGHLFLLMSCHYYYYYYYWTLHLFKTLFTIYLFSFCVFTNYLELGVTYTVCSQFPLQDWRRPCICAVLNRGSRLTFGSRLFSGVADPRERFGDLPVRACGGAGGPLQTGGHHHLAPDGPQHSAQCWWVTARSLSTRSSAPSLPLTYFVW